MNISYLVMILIIFQGIIGWIMVKSGLVENTTVSHYRLSIHLTTALIIISIIFWLINNVVFKCNKKFFKISSNNFPFQFLILLIFLQIVVGAFVSGLDAGKIYQTWPLMGESYFPNDLSIDSSKKIFEFDNHSLVQFYHRNLAYLIIVYYLFLFLYFYRKRVIFLYNSFKILSFFLFLQIILGVFTLTSGLNIYLASAHQVTGVMLVLSALNLYYLRAK